ncbi:MAG: hypothetical protein RIS64_1955 [Bacteroidota bacterium]|jgi:hypothetical protein
MFFFADFAEKDSKRNSAKAVGQVERKKNVRI